MSETFKQALHWAEQCAPGRCFSVQLKDSPPVIVLFVPEDDCEDIIKSFERHTNSSYVKLRNSQRTKGKKWRAETTLRCHLDPPSRRDSRAGKRHPSKYLVNGCKSMIEIKRYRIPSDAIVDMRTLLRSSNSRDTLNNGYESLMSDPSSHLTLSEAEQQHLIAQAQAGDMGAHERLQMALHAMEQRELEAEAERRKWVHVWIQPTHSHDLNGPDNIRHLPIDDMVIAFIEERLMQGVQVHRISQMLRDHLQQTTTLRPDQLTTRRFCPTTKDIYNINLQAKAKRRLQQTIAQAEAEGTPLSAIQTRGVVPSVKRLYELLMDEGQTAMRWSDDGHAIVITQDADKLMPILHANFAYETPRSLISFLWATGFQKISTDPLTYHHPMFQRDREDLLPHVHRKLDDALTPHTKRMKADGEPESSDDDLDSLGPPAHMHLAPPPPQWGHHHHHQHMENYQPLDDNGPMPLQHHLPPLVPHHSHLEHLVGPPPHVHPHTVHHQVTISHHHHHHTHPHHGLELDEAEVAPGHHHHTHTLTHHHPYQLAPDPTAQYEILASHEHDPHVQGLHLTAEDLHAAHAQHVQGYPIMVHPVPYPMHGLPPPDDPSLLEEDELQQQGAVLVPDPTSLHHHVHAVHPAHAAHHTHSQYQHDLS